MYYKSFAIPHACVTVKIKGVPTEAHIFKTPGFFFDRVLAALFQCSDIKLLNECCSSQIGLPATLHVSRRRCCVKNSLISNRGDQNVLWPHPLWFFYGDLWSRKCSQPVRQMSINETKKSGGKKSGEWAERCARKWSPISTIALSHVGIAETDINSTLFFVIDMGVFTVTITFFSWVFNGFFAELMRF